MVVTLPEARTPDSSEINDNVLLLEEEDEDEDHVLLSEEEDEGQGEEMDKDDSDLELELVAEQNNQNSEKSSTRARTHVITRSRSTSDLYVCDLDEDPVSNGLDQASVMVVDSEPERVQSNPEQDSQGVILTSSTPSLKALREGRNTRLRSTLPSYYERSPSVTLKDDPYHNLLQTSAEKVLNKLKSRQLILSQEQLNFHGRDGRSSSRPQLNINSVPRKLKPLFSGEENKRTSFNKGHESESEPF